MKKIIILKIMLISMISHADLERDFELQTNPFANIRGCYSSNKNLFFLCTNAFIHLKYKFPDLKPSEISYAEIKNDGYVYFKSYKGLIYKGYGLAGTGDAH